MNNSSQLSTANINYFGFSQSVFKWFAHKGRDFPWRKTSDPYCIFVAEVLLRKTQAKRVVQPYLEFIKRYPSFEELSMADIEVLRRWFKPLGLIKRAELLVSSAKLVVSKYRGVLPSNLDLIVQFPGMGNYSARAVACLAFGARVPMIDESSGRLLRRVLGLSRQRPAYSDRELLTVAATFVPKRRSRDFNLGLLDIASAYCHINNPICLNCPLVKFCSYGKTRVDST